MLLVGLTGPIASGKSTAARTLAGLGALVVDADALARDVLEPGTPGLAAVVDRFGSGVLTPDGRLDRAALAAVVFADDGARRDLEGIVHPAVARAFEEVVAAAPADAVVVHDVPLLVENGLAPRYHLVLVTTASVDTRVERAVRERGMTRQQVLARIEAQASDAERRAVADVLISTERPHDEVVAQLTQLWNERLVPYEENVRTRRRAVRHPAVLVADPVADPWAAQAARLLARIRAVGGDLVQDAAHIGSTSVPHLVAKDVIDLQVGVASLAAAEQLSPLLEAAGFPRTPGVAQDTPKPGLPDPARWSKTFHGTADPGRSLNLHVRVVGSPGWRWALAFRDWLRADIAARERYAEHKLAVLAATAADLTDESPTWAYAEAKEPWFTQIDGELTDWITSTAWAPRI